MRHSRENSAISLGNGHITSSAGVTVSPKFNNRCV